MPLGYESLNAVLQYMDANQRVQLRLRCPNIRNTEKLVPLRIHQLTFGRMRVELNGTRYSLGVYRHYPPGETIPEHHSHDNDVGGSQMDFDKFGMEDHMSPGTLTPGDVDLCSTNRELLTEDEVDRQHRGMEIEMDILLRQQKEMMMNGPERYYEGDYGKKMADLENRIASYDRKLQPHYCKMDNLPPPFTHVLQLTIQSAQGTTIERYQYSRKLFEAMKYLNMVLVGGRRSEVQVSILALLDTKYIYRFPQGWKLKVRGIYSKLIEYQRLDGIINPCHYPSIDFSVTDSGNNPSMYNQPAIKNAKSLTVDDWYYFWGHEFFQFLRDLETKRVAFREEMPARYYTSLAKNWLENGKPIGSLYIFGFEYEIRVVMLLREIREENEDRVKELQDSSVTFEMPTGSSQLQIYYKQGDRDEACWQLVFKVEQI